MSANRRRTVMFFIFDFYRYPELWDLWESMRYRDDASWCYLYRGSYYEGYLNHSPLMMQIKNGNPCETLFLALNDIESDIAEAGLIVVSPDNLSELHQYWLFWIPPREGAAFWEQGHSRNYALGGDCSRSGD